MKPDASDLMELGRDLFQYLTHLDRSMPVDERRRRVIGAMAHLTPTGSMILVPSVVDTVIEQETLAFTSK